MNANLEDFIRFPLHRLDEEECGNLMRVAMMSGFPSPIRSTVRTNMIFCCTYRRRCTVLYVRSVQVKAVLDTGEQKIFGNRTSCTHSYPKLQYVMYCARSYVQRADLVLRLCVYAPQYGQQGSSVYPLNEEMDLLNAPQQTR